MSVKCSKSTFGWWKAHHQSAALARKNLRIWSRIMHKNSYHKKYLKSFGFFRGEFFDQLCKFTQNITLRNGQLIISNGEPYDWLMWANRLRMHKNLDKYVHTSQNDNEYLKSMHELETQKKALNSTHELEIKLNVRVRYSDMYKHISLLLFSFLNSFM